MTLSLVGFFLIALVAVATAMERPDAMADDARDVFPGIGEYYFNGIPVNWTQAYQHCRLLGHRLVMIDSVEEADAINSMMVKYDAPAVHVGFHDRFVEGDFITLKGRSVVDGADGFMWAPGAPTFDSDVNCGLFTPEGSKDSPCGELQVYMCEVLPVPTPPPADYNEIQDFGYYKAYANPRRWPDADAQCRQDGAHLVIINSGAEADALRVFYNLNPPTISWLGAHRFFGGNSDFVTIRDDPLSTTGYATWLIDEPSQTFVTNPYLFFAYVDVATYGLAASPWTTFRSFICEYDNQ